MRKSRLILLSILLCFSGTASAFGAEQPLNDIAGYWAEKEITAAYEAGIVSGYPDGSFQPDKYVTRAEFAAILSNAFDLSGEAGTHFDDVSETAWYYPYIGGTMPYIGASDGLDAARPDAVLFHGEENLHRIDAYEAFIDLLLDKAGQKIELPSPEKLFEEVTAKYQDIDYHAGDLSRMAHPNVKRLFEYTWLADHLALRNLEKPGNFYPHSGMSRAEAVWIVADMQARLAENN
ncbi:MAG: S-layer homology domain-containing protein [Clostridiales bacterium]|jgi:hypothetical protein|nr:S-layer homology domain-containing protein [Clostridiales bacterium]